MKKSLAVFAGCLFVFICGNADAIAPGEGGARPRILISDNASLQRQNEIINQYGLPRIRDMKELEQYLLPPPFFVKVVSPYLDVVDKVGGYAILPTRDFALMFGERFHKTFHKNIKITSILRPCVVQKIIFEKGESVADCETPGSQSTHLTGIAFDISRLPFGYRELRWVRKELVAYKKQGKIDAYEEIWNNAFHITVCPNWQTGSCF
jgi:hypothetical protein